MRIAIALLLLVCQDDKSAADLVEKLKSAPDEKVFEIEQEILALGETARPALEAAAKAGDKRAGGVVDKLDVRRKAAGLPKSWGDRWYSIYGKALKVGWVHSKVEETKVGEETLLLFTDELYVKGGEGEIKANFKIVCRPDEYLTLVTIEGKVDNAGQVNEFSAEVKKGGRLVVKSGGGKEATKVAPNFIPDFAVLRLVTLFPSTLARPYDLSVIQLLKGERIRQDSVMSEKDEEITVEGRKLTARRFIWSDDAEEPRDRFLWVDKEGRLVRLQAEETEFALSTEKDAKDLD